MNENYNTEDLLFDDTSEIERYDGETEIVTDVEEIKEMTLSMKKENEKQLANLRNNVLLKLDKRKMVEVEAISDIMDSILDTMLSNIVDIKPETALDIKLMSEAYAKLADARQKATRLDTINGDGTAGKVKLAVRFESGSGSTVETAVEIKGQ